VACEQNNRTRAGNARASQHLASSRRARAASKRRTASESLSLNAILAAGLPSEKFAHSLSRKTGLLIVGGISRPRARQRHTRSEVHSAHITLMRADQALLDVVDIVVHSAVTERLLRGRGRGRGAAAARGCRRAASAKGCPRSVLMARAQQHRLVGEGAALKARPRAVNRSHSFGTPGTSIGTLELRESSPRAFQRYPRRPLAPTR
jgi:hypothetical protein